MCVCVCYACALYSETFPSFLTALKAWHRREKLSHREETDFNFEDGPWVCQWRAAPTQGAPHTLNPPKKSLALAISHTNATVFQL